MWQYKYVWLFINDVATKSSPPPSPTLNTHTHLCPLGLCLTQGLKLVPCRGNWELATCRENAHRNSFRIDVALLLKCAAEATQNVWRPQRHFGSVMHRMNSYWMSLLDFTPDKECIEHMYTHIFPTWKTHVEKRLHVYLWKCLSASPDDKRAFCIAW